MLCMKYSTRTTHSRSRESGENSTIRRTDKVKRDGRKANFKKRKKNEKKLCNKLCDAS